MSYLVDGYGNGDGDDDDDSSHRKPYAPQGRLEFSYIRFGSLAPHPLRTPKSMGAGLTILEEL